MKKETGQLIFGEDTIQDAIRNISPNPCVNVYGRGPEGCICKNCSHLYVKQYSGKYFKCDLRKNTNGPGSDHRVRWPACAKYTTEIL